MTPYELTDHEIGLVKDGTWDLMDIPEYLEEKIIGPRKTNRRAEK